MSGHSKWSKIKRQKGANDLKKGNLFTKLGQGITLAVREGGGGDEDMNFMLRVAVEKAKSANMPKSTIERAIKKGLGEGDAGPMSTISYEVVGKEGSGIIVDCFTDNKNRTLTDIRKAITGDVFSIGEGSIGWQFEEKGQILIEPIKLKEVDQFKKGVEKEEHLDIDEVMLELMELEGVEDILKKTDEEGVPIIEIFTEKTALSAVFTAINEQQYKVNKVSLIKRAKDLLTVSDAVKKQVTDFVNELSENPDIEAVWTNVNLQ